MSSPAIDPPRLPPVAAAGRSEQWERDRAARDAVRTLLHGVPLGFVVFHDLELPKPSRAIVDHLVIGPRSIWAVSTHVLTEAVTFGQGRNSDTLWSGRAPLRTMLESADWEASTIGDRIGVDVEPIVCLVAPELPETAFDFLGIRISEPDSLVHQVATSTADFVDVERAADAVGRTFGVRPEAGTATPTLGAATMVPTHRAPAPPRPRRSLGARWHALRSVTAVRLAAVLALLAVVLGFLPTIVGLWTSVADEGAERLVDVLDEAAPTDGSPTSAIRSPSPVPYTLVCPAPGAGWVAEWGWPGALPDGVAGYGIRTRVGDAPPIVHTLVPWADAASAPPEAGVSSIATTMVFTDHRAADGRVLGTTSASIAAPAEPC